MFSYDVIIDHPSTPAQISQSFLPRDFPYSRENLAYPSAFSQAIIPPGTKDYTITLQHPGFNPETVRSNGNASFCYDSNTKRVTFTLSGEESFISFNDPNNYQLTYRRTILDY